MQTIHPLSSDLIASIAAGEVVENSASVVKELVENSIDAGATQIDVELVEGGLSLIVIGDNGKGMSKEDIELCFLPHTTSKIKTSDDLLRIASFGFRGEALWSIAAVSHLTIKSREQHSENGIEVQIKNGKIIHQSSAGIPTGTEISVEGLFYSTPARKKFMKDAVTETRNVVEVLLNFSLAFPHIGFSLTHDTKTLLDMPQGQELSHRLTAVLGDYRAQHMLPLSTTVSSYGTARGYISRPQLAGRARSHQYVYINNRAVSSTALSKYVGAAYSNLIEPRSFPVFIIFLDIPYDHVDVNVHPRKEEVAFIYEQEIGKLIHQAVTETLTSNDLTFRDIQDDSYNGMDFTMASMLRSDLTPWNVKDIPAQDIVQINNVYLLAPSSYGLLLIDQHAAHERILYEQFLESFTNKKLEADIYDLPESLLIELPRGEALLLEQELEKFKSIGFDIEPFGERTFKICSVPLVFKNRNIHATIMEVLEQIKEFGSIKSIDKETDRTLSFLACRTAIKGGEALTTEERKRLIEKLLEVSETNRSYTCPHGRPTHIEVTLSELDKMFKRRM